MCVQLFLFSFGVHFQLMLNIGAGGIDNSRWYFAISPQCSTSIFCKQLCLLSASCLRSRSYRTIYICPYIYIDIYHYHNRFVSISVLWLLSEQNIKTNSQPTNQPDTQCTQHCAAEKDKNTEWIVKKNAQTHRERERETTVKYLHLVVVQNTIISFHLGCDSLAHSLSLGISHSLPFILL